MEEGGCRAISEDERCVTEDLTDDLECWYDRMENMGCETCLEEIRNGCGDERTKINDNISSELDLNELTAIVIYHLFPIFRVRSLAQNSDFC